MSLEIENQLPLKERWNNLIARVDQLNSKLPSREKYDESGAKQEISSTDSPVDRINKVLGLFEELAEIIKEYYRLRAEQYKQIHDPNDFEALSIEAGLHDLGELLEHRYRLLFQDIGHSVYASARVQDKLDGK